MLGIIKDSFKITNKFLVQLATPVMLFSLLSGLYLVLSANSSKMILFIPIILFFLMLGAFIAGWFYMITDCIKNIDLEDKNFSWTVFPAGVGEYFLSSLGLIFNILIIGGVIFFAAQIIGNHYIGDLGISVGALRNAQISNENAKLFYESLTSEQILKFIQWVAISAGATTLSSFLFMFYLPALLYKSKNPYKALLISFKDLFSRRILKNIFLFIIILCSYFLLILISGILNFNIVTQFIFNLINFYYVIFIAVFVFNYYYNNYVKIGAQIDVQV